MKKFLCIVFATLLLCSCSGKENRPQTETEKEKIIGVWLSFYELNSMLEGGNFKEEFSSAVNKMAAEEISDAFVHVRAFGDSLFESKYYPVNERIKKYDFDVLEFMIVTFKENGIRFHAWINPFRTANGGFSNPADEDVRKNIILGIREIIEKYDTDGIHFDDYFYPSDFDGSDDENFSAVKQASKDAITLAEYKTASVTSLIYSVKNAIKHINPEIIFSISPAADMEKNQNKSFADVNYWCENGAVDWIIPQLYFGFEYPMEKFRFENLLNEWRSLPRDDGVSLIIGLASYKIGTTAEPDCEEWQNGADILPRQVKIVGECEDISGVCFFSYSSLFSPSPLNTYSRTAAFKEIEEWER